MILIFGGAYQGKLEYAKDNFKIETVFDCRDAVGSNGEVTEPGTDEIAGADAAKLPEPDVYADAICGLEAFVSACTKSGIEAADWFRDRRDQWQDKILIIQDQSQGIVPMDATERAAREMNGRLMIYLAGEATEVYRVFCGIGKRIK